MKHLTRYSLLFTIFICCAGFSMAQNGKPPRGEVVTSRSSPENDPKSWKEFSSTEGRFTILFPGVPTEAVQPLDSPYGKVDQHGFILKTSAYYVVTYTDYPRRNGIQNANAYFNGFRDANLIATDAQLLKEKDDDRFETFPGRFIQTRMRNGYVNRIRLHLIWNRVYILLVAIPEKDVDAETLKFYEEAAAKFLDSFKPKTDQPPAEDVAKYDRFGDPRPASPPLRPPLLPSGGINIDPVLVNGANAAPDAKVNGGVLNGKALSLPKPTYSQEAKDAGASGEVEVKIVVDESGNVIWARAITGHPLLQKAAQDAAYQAKFPPTTVEGKPEKVAGILVYKFVR